MSPPVSGIDFKGKFIECKCIVFECEDEIIKAKANNDQNRLNQAKKLCCGQSSEFNRICPDNWKKFERGYPDFC